MVAISELEMECQQETSPPLLSGEYDELKEYLESEGGSRADARYVEVLEQQQAWLVHGLQELYRRTIEGKPCPKKPLNPGHGGFSLTQNLLTHLGVLDPCKGERFEQKLEAMQPERWHTDGPLQGNELSKCGTVSDQSPVARSGFLSVALPPHATPPTLATYIPTVDDLNFESQMPTHPRFEWESMVMHQTVMNTLSLQDNSQWECGNTEFNLFETLDLVTRADSTTLPVEGEENLSSMSYLQNPIDFMPKFSHMYLKDDWDALNEISNPHPTDVTR
ncbi:hypothetical protein DTO013E5_9173 [Penicillium roqueforti]|nr:hypothetical protein DTO012A1_8709 [Penicillium roqueforti]KAI2740255.1 hypothetical protein DTO013F2_9138 [Penicillium roqueforti]KAI2756317.1 hypothetical protein DTO006G1_7957 [Penicillium roqueforti]KAI3199902.1 hypothetical protein DTO013E5_9173 [Penicillium roqueforti]KAI3249435.1 hypothetical protein DTO006G7_9209 [Penicillium roqueforti]